MCPPFGPAPAAARRRKWSAARSFSRASSTVCGPRGGGSIRTHSRAPPRDQNLITPRRHRVHPCVTSVARRPLHQGALGKATPRAREGVGWRSLHRQGGRAGSVDDRGGTHAGGRFGRRQISALRVPAHGVPLPQLPRAPRRAIVQVALHGRTSAVLCRNRCIMHATSASHPCMCVACRYRYATYGESDSGKHEELIA